MATVVGFQRDLIDLLQRLVGLDLDAVAAYAAALDQLEDPSHRGPLSTFAEDHEHHVRELREHLHDRGISDPATPDAQRVPAEGGVVTPDLSGDRSVFSAMKGTADDAVAAYERALSRDDLSPRLRALFERNRSDERRHRDWFRERLR